MAKSPLPAAARGAPSGAAPAPRAGGPRAVGALIGAVGHVAFRRFGFVQAGLVQRWSEIVGADHARWALPQSLKPGRGEGRGGVLTILVEGAFAPRLQHAAPVIIERINRLFGRGTVARVRLVHGSVPRRPAACPRADQGRGDDPPPPSNLRGIADDGLRQALESLAAALARAGGPPRIG